MTIYQDFSSRTKQYLRAVMFLILVGVMISSFALAFWFGISGIRASQEVAGERQISVSGEGKISARPDIAQFTASVLTEEKTVAEAQSANTNASNAVLAFIKDKGIDARDIKTVNYSISPQYRYTPCEQIPCPSRESVLTGYQVRHSLHIKVRDLGLVDDLLAGIAQHGVNEVGSVTFSVEDETAAKEAARKKAIENAKQKARVLAKDLDVRLGKIIGFSESGGVISIFSRKSVAFEALVDASPTPQVESGEQEITVNVTITYEFR